MSVNHSLSTEGYMEFIKLYRKEIGINFGGTKNRKETLNNENQCNRINRTCEAILSVDKNDHRLCLPLRVSLSSFKIGIPILSFGCIIRHHDKTSDNIYYLCLKREYSTAYLELIRGTYKDSNLYFLLRALPASERKDING